MKKLTLISAAGAGILTFSAFLYNPVPAQTNPIPDNVLAIAEKSCVKCHTEPGKTLALAKVNLTKWNDYSAEKQASKADAMCNMVTKGKMPPKKFKAENPDFVMTEDEIKTICDWSSSIKK